MERTHMILDDESRISLVKWATRQPFTNILLSAILITLAWFGQWVLNAVPSHLAQIQAGYERLTKIDAEERAKDRAQFKDLIDYILQAQGKTATNHRVDATTDN